MIKKHNCEKLYEEAMGCSICANLLLKSPIKSKKELRKIIKFCNWKIITLTMEINKLKMKLKQMKKQ